jgi:AraC-like DNA-binding protein
MKKPFLIMGGSALLLVSLLVGGVFAVHSAFAQSSTAVATPTPTSKTATNYCNLYQQDLAKRLGVSVSTLQSDRKGAFEDTLAQKVKDGKLTQAQADKIKQRVEAKQACTGSSANKLEKSQLRQFLAKYRSDLITPVAQGLHLTSSQLTTQLQAGKSLTTIAQAQKVSTSALQTIVLNATKSTLSKAVSAGDITQAQANTFNQFLQKHPAQVEHFIAHRVKQSKK